MLIRLVILVTFTFTFIHADLVKEEMWGFSFNNPQGWKYQKNMDGAILGHDTVPGLILVFPHQLKAMAALKAEMQQGISDDGGYLRLSGTLNQTKYGYTGSYSGMYDAQQVKAESYGTLSPHGGGAIIIVMSTSEAFSNELSGAGKSIVSSLKYMKQTTSDLAKHFVGIWSSYSQYSETHVTLYPDGTYSDSTTSSYGNSDPSMGAQWGMASDTHGRGRWQVRGNRQRGQLIMTSPSGDTVTYNYQVHTKNGQTYWSEYYFGNSLYGKKPLR
jgi:hypothetical protein